MQELPEMHAGFESGGAKGTVFEFFTLLSPFTRESVFLADYPSLTQRKLVSSVTNRFAENLLASKDWQTRSEDYLKLLRKQK